MTFQNDTDRERRRKSAAEPGDGDGETSRARRRKTQPAEVGDALRSVYQRAVAEDIPPEMLDLLGKLE